MLEQFDGSIVDAADRDFSGRRAVVAFALPAMARLGVVGVGGYRRLPRWVRRASVAAGPAKVQTAKRRLNGGIVARSRITEMRRFRPAPTMA